jgi:hypothetical protein
MLAHKMGAYSCAYTSVNLNFIWCFLLGACELIHNFVCKEKTCPKYTKKLVTTVQNLIGWARRCIAENSKIANHDPMFCSPNPLFWSVNRQFILTFLKHLVICVVNILLLFVSCNK